MWISGLLEDGDSSYLKCNFRSTKEPASSAIFIQFHTRFLFRSKGAKCIKISFDSDSFLELLKGLCDMVRKEAFPKQKYLIQIYKPTTKESESNQIRSQGVLRSYAHHGDERTTRGRATNSLWGRDWNRTIFL